MIKWKQLHFEACGSWCGEQPRVPFLPAPSSIWALMDGQLSGSMWGRDSTLPLPVEPASSSRAVITPTGQEKAELQQRISRGACFPPIKTRREKLEAVRLRPYHPLDHLCIVFIEIIKGKVGGEKKSDVKQAVLRDPVWPWHQSAGRLMGSYWISTNFIPLGRTLFIFFLINWSW